jgi:hypothetical protein
MKVSGIFDLAGAVILLAIIGTLATKPKLVTETLGGFTQLISAAKR